MVLYKVNSKGKKFIELRKKKIKEFAYIFPILFLFTIGAGIIKLGFSSYSITIIILTIPILLIAIKKGISEPKKFVNNLIIKIELHQEEVLLISKEGPISSNEIKLKKNLQLFETTFHKYYIVYFNNIEYYIIPEFFDNFENMEKKLNLRISKKV
jgi:hypothetical protein